MSIRTQLAFDSFSGADINPLNPAKWTLTTGGFSNPIQQKSNLAIATAFGGNTSSMYYSGATFPANQYVEAIIGALANTDVLGLMARATLDSTSAYEVQLSKDASGNGTLVFAGGGLSVVVLSPFSIRVGDIVAIECLGTKITLLYNGVVLSSQTDAAIASGVVNININPSVSVSGTGFSRFSAGSLAGSYSQPDCRATTSTTPNVATSVQGTLTYNVPKTDSRSQGASVDSRTSKPVDSRAVNVSQNCRTPGTFGPGQ